MAAVISINQFKQMQSYETLTINQKERQKKKWIFIDRIKSKVNIRWERSKKVLSVIDEIIYKATDRGYSFNGRETLAEKCNVSLSTVDKAIKLLKQSGEAFVAYRTNPSSNGIKTPIIILKKHENFTHWQELLGLENNVEHKVENVAKPVIPMDEGTKKVSTYSLPSKQEINNNINNSKIFQYVFNRVNDAVKEGSTIKYISSYVDKVFRSLEQQALHAENNRLIAMRKKRENEAHEFFNKPKEVPFYNWLEQ
jgi:transcriptional regulator